MPIFMLASTRLYKEIAAARGGMARGLVTAIHHGMNVLAHMFSPTRMARRVTQLQTTEISLPRLEVRTLVITGEDRLERVVPPARTREYLDICPNAKAVVLERTGHLGLITRPEAFTGIVAPFLERASSDLDTTLRLSCVEPGPPVSRQSPGRETGSNRLNSGSLGA
jgi:pimeloyl-ACP methyl ester carboxylesterase